MSRLSKQANTIGLISRISGRFISFYADDLAAMIMDDLLGDAAKDIQKLEAEQKEHVRKLENNR